MRPARARILARDDRAATEPIGIILVVAIVVVLAAGFGLIASKYFSKGKVDPVASGAKASFGSDGYWLEPTGPDDIPVAGTRLQILVDGTETFVPLSAFSSQLGGDPTWHVGVRLCIVGNLPGCWRAQASTIELTVFTQGNYVFSVRDLLRQDPSYSLGDTGSGVTITFSTPMRIDNVGSQISCGGSQSSPTIPVTARFTQDNGATWSNLWGGAAVQVDPQPPGSQNVTFAAIPVGAVVGIEGHTLSAGGCSPRTYDSVSGSPHVLVLGPGDNAPNKPAYAGQAPLAGFLAPYVNTYSQTMVLDVNQVILLFEFTDDLSDASADFQDLVILFTFG